MSLVIYSTSTQSCRTNIWCFTAHSSHLCCLFRPLFVGRCWSRLSAVRKQSLNAFLYLQSGRQRSFRDLGLQRKCCFCGKKHNITSTMSTTSSWRRGECKFSGCTSCKPGHCDRDNGSLCNRLDRFVLHQVTLSPLLAILD